MLHAPFDWTCSWTVMESASYRSSTPPSTVRTYDPLGGAYFDTMGKISTFLEVNL
jgi:hypothetical protein